MKYKSKPTEVEAMRWWVQGAEEIVAWVNASGGEARYEPSPGPNYDVPDSRIAVRTINGWAYAAPGDYVVMGDEWIGHVGEEFVGVRDFYPCDPETFERRWEPA